LRDYKLKERIGELKGALALVETSLEEQTDCTDRLADLRTVVGNTRKSLWAILTATNSDDFNGFMAEFRLRRATETFQAVEAGIANRSVTPPEALLDDLAMNLDDVLDAIPQFVDEAAASRTVFRVR
jgi:hypothetical protein